MENWIIKDELYGAIFSFICFLCFFCFFFEFQNQSPSTSVVKENAALLFCCEAPQMFRGPSPNLERWVNNDYIFFFRWPFFFFFFPFNKAATVVFGAASLKVLEASNSNPRPGLFLINIKPQHAKESLCAYNIKGSLCVCCLHTWITTSEEIQNVFWSHPATPPSVYSRFCSCRHTLHKGDCAFWFLFLSASVFAPFQQCRTFNGAR